MGYGTPMILQFIFFFLTSTSSPVGHFRQIESKEGELKAFYRLSLADIVHCFIVVYFQYLSPLKR